MKKNSTNEQKHRSVYRRILIMLLKWSFGAIYKNLRWRGEGGRKGTWRLVKAWQNTWAVISIVCAIFCVARWWWCMIHYKYTYCILYTGSVWRKCGGGGGGCGLVIRNIVALLPLPTSPLNTLYRILLLIGLDSLVIHFILIFHRSAD